ncbi:Signal recognition particle subunit [Brachionus plicatilis]|uniref:Signal recognition particle subunit n=1 Tax=Brachionus plicatilis TaxID=10195 RepID=A0A3M7PDH5_BRAPC|nr:Signal recognition particle subunit [Brachionus plicatilis]
MKCKKCLFIYVQFILLMLFFYNFGSQSNDSFTNPQQNFESTLSPPKTDNLEEALLKLNEKLLLSENKEFSQNGEDGVIQEILKQFLNKNRGNYVEIGAGNGIESNTRYLRENNKWNGISFDFNNNNQKLNVMMQKITHMNILKILKKFKIDHNLDLLSIDTDFSDYWILEKILSEYHPKIVIHEINQQPPDECVSVTKLNGLALWDNNSKYYGASICAYFCLAYRFDYSMIYCESQGINCFWIQNDILREKFGKLSINAIRNVLNATFLFKEQKEKYQEQNRRSWTQIEKVKFYSKPNIVNF